MNNKIAVCLLVCAGGLLPAHTYGIDLSQSSTWGQSGSVSDYYYEEQECFRMDDNMFQYGESFVQDMGSTSCMELGGLGDGQFYTAALNIEAGTTIDDYQRKAIARAIGKGGGGHWEPPTNPVPVGDGWDVYALLLLLAGAVSFIRRRKQQKVNVC